MIFLVYCISYFLCFMMSVLSPALRDTPMARYRLFMLKVPLNTNKPTKNLGAVTSCCICLTLYTYLPQPRR